MEILVAAIISVILIYVALIVLITSLWKIFTKAGKPGWATIVPFTTLL